MKIDARGLRFLLKESPSSMKPWRMIMEVRKHPHQIESIEGELEMDDNPSVDAVEFDKYHKTNIEFTLNDLYYNALKRPAFKKYLFRDIPEQKLGKKFKNGESPSKTIRLPRELRRLLNPDDIDLIQEYWDKNFAGETYLHHLDKDLKPNFIA